MPLLQNNMPLLQNNMPLLQNNMPLLQNNMPLLTNKVPLLQDYNSARNPELPFHRMKLSQLTERKSHKQPNKNISNHRILTKPFGGLKD